ncbi:hypothetical protein IFHNHDMJ_01739 [Synechococcus sp. CBW1107]|nr:hypothetical protein IFHNHDMJ_01739 [Synechococcus sp. CBW1107]
MFTLRWHRGRQVAAVTGQGEAAGAHPWLPRRRAGIGAEAVVEAPAEDLLAQQVHLGLLLRVGAALEQAPVGIGLPARAAEHGAGVEAAAGPDPFPLQGRIEREGRLPLLGVAQRDRIGEGIGRKAQAQEHRCLAPPPAPAAPPAASGGSAVQGRPTAPPAGRPPGPGPPPSRRGPPVGRGRPGRHEAVDGAGKRCASSGLR